MCAIGDECVPVLCVPVKISGSQETSVGQKIFLQCEATGMYKAPDDVEWIKDGEKVETDSDSGIIITKQVKGRTLISVLVVQSSDLSSAGNYVCKVARGITSTMTVHVNNGRHHFRCILKNTVVDEFSDPNLAESGPN